jgi:hypothetical protein
MKNRCLPLLLLGLLAACRPATDDPQTPAPTASVTARQLDGFIRQKLQQEGYFDWRMASDEQVVSALALSDRVLSVGYQPAGTSGDVRAGIDRIDLQSPDWQTARQRVLELILAQEQKLRPGLKTADLEVFPETTLPVVDVLVQNPETVRQLRQSPLVRYAEPMGYEPRFGNAASRTASDSGCGSNTAVTDLAEGTDYTVTTPNGKVSWNLPFHNVPAAWSQSTGAGITIQVIDTGCSPDQPKLGAQFTQGDSPNRTITKLVTLPRATFLGIPVGPVETPADGCGHGTSMLGTSTGPRGTDGTTVGVAYRASVVSVRAAADVYLDESREVKGVSDAFTLAGNRTDVRIVSLSLGRLTSSGQMTDAIRYAYNRGKLIFAAAGTSFDWSAGLVGVIFPATLPECVAVTGVKDGPTLQRCDACHQGSKVDFALVMEKITTGRHPLSLAMSGDVPSTVGGSSVSTSSTAGMAALVWAKYPSLSRDQILNKLKVSGSAYPNRDANLGWGKIDVVKALNTGVQ